MIDRASGPLLFARYAFPPNHYGYCGPEDADGFFRSGVAGDDHGLRARARNFDVISRRCCRRRLTLPHHSFVVFCIYPWLSIPARHRHKCSIAAG